MPHGQVMAMPRLTRLIERMKPRTTWVRRSVRKCGTTNNKELSKVDTRTNFAHKSHVFDLCVRRSALSLDKCHERKRLRAISNPRGTENNTASSKQGVRSKERRRETGPQPSGWRHKS